MPDIFFEDLIPGTVTTYGHRRVEADEIVAFAREYDAQPFHLSEETARDTFVGRLIASGWHTIALEMRMLCDAWLLRAAAMGSPGIEEVRWLKPVLPGDVLSIRQTILDAKPSRSRPEMGVVRFRFETLNGRGETVMEQTNPIMFGRREPGSTVAGIRDAGRAGRPDAAQVGYGDLRRTSDGGLQIGRFFEDLEVGRTDILGEHTFTAEEVVRFASMFDPQPFHVEEAAARASHFGQLIASGWQTAALWMSRLVQARAAAIVEAQAGGRAPPRFGPSHGFKDLRWLKPVHPGDTIRYATTLTDKRHSASRPGWGLTFSHNSGWNQRGEKVFSFEGSGFIGMRAAPSA